MHQDPSIDCAISFIHVLFDGNSDGHDFSHSMRVYRTAMLIADSEPSCNRLIVALAALLHDADDPKLFRTDSNANARKFLSSRGLDPAAIDEICLVINAVSFSKNKGKRPDSIEAMIVQDADRLDALGAVGIARTFAYGGKHDRTPDSSILHFYEKLLTLKDLMNTKKAKELAEKRHRYMEGFLQEWREETADFICR